jgi:osmotically inducible protein OsmC
MPVRKAKAVWVSDLASGAGRMLLGNGAFEGGYSFASRFEEGPGTNPEELIAAAHAGCFSMALAHILAQSGFRPKRIQTEGQVCLDRVGDGFRISSIHLVTEAEVAGLEETALLGHARAAKDACPVSQALQGTEISLEARLL